MFFAPLGRPRGLPGTPFWNCVAFGGLQRPTSYAALITDANKSRGLIGVRSGARPTRRRYSIAHELGHFLSESHRPTVDGGFACSKEDLSNPFGATRHVRQEREANLVAIEVLTPRDQLAPILKPAADIERAMRIARRFEVSGEAALRRYVDLHSETLAVAFSKDGRLRYLHRKDGFPWIRLEKSDPIGETPSPPRDGERITSMDEVDAETWIDNGVGHRLFAQTLSQAGGFATTLLLCELREDPDDMDLPRFR